MSKANIILFLFLCCISLSCDIEYSKYKIPNEPVFDESYYKSSLITIEDFIQRNPSIAEGYYKKAVVLSKINNNKEAENSIEEAIQLENNPNFYLLATQLYLENGKTDKGLNAAMEAEKAGMINDWLFSIIANLTLQNGDSSKAFQYIDKAISSNPQNPVNYINKGNLLLTIKDTVKAMESFNSGLKIDSKNEDVLTILTDLNIAQRNFKKAEDLIYQKLQNQKPDLKTNIQLAHILWKTGNYDSARVSFKKIIKQDSLNHSVYNSLSQIDFQRKQYDSAVWYAEKSLSLKNDEKEAILTVARVKDLKRQYYNALIQYDKILKLDSSFTIAKVERARIQKKINNLAREQNQERAPVLPQIQQRF